MSEGPKLFRVTLEVSNLEEAATFYAKLFDTEGKRHPGARHYFNCGGVIVAVIDVSQGGLTPTPGPKSLKALAPYKVHGEAAGEVKTRPWREKSFYVVDKWGNDLCFVEEGTLYT